MYTNVTVKMRNMASAAATAQQQLLQAAMTRQRIQRMRRAVRVLHAKLRKPMQQKRVRAERTLVTG